jgi:hypothetical protein
VKSTATRAEHPGGSSSTSRETTDDGGEESSLRVWTLAKALEFFQCSRVFLQDIPYPLRAGRADNEPGVRHVIKRTPTRDGFGCATDVASARLPEELLQHRLDVAGANRLFHRRPQPRGGMVVSMPSQHVAGAADLS